MESGELKAGMLSSMFFQFVGGLAGVILSLDILGRSQRKCTDVGRGNLIVR